MFVYLVEVFPPAERLAKGERVQWVESIRTCVYEDHGDRYVCQIELSDRRQDACRLSAEELAMVLEFGQRQPFSLRVETCRVPYAVSVSTQDEYQRQDMQTRGVV